MIVRNADLRLTVASRRISISPQCGFASVFEGNPITEEVSSRVLHRHSTGTDSRTGREEEAGVGGGCCPGDMGLRVLCGPWAATE